MSDVLKAVLKTVYGITDEQAAGILTKPDDEQASEIIAMDATRVKKFKDAQTEAHDKGHKKGKAETLTTYESGLRTKFEIDDDALQGDDLITAIVQKSAGTGTTHKRGALTDDEIKAHPLYISLQEQGKRELKAANQEWQEKYDKFESDIDKKERVSKAKAEAETILNGMNPIIPKNADVAANIKNLFGKELEGYDYDFQDGVIVVTKDGKVVEDAHGKRTGFDEIVKSIGSRYFEFSESTERGSAGNDSTVLPGGSQPSKFKNLTELSSYIDDRTVSAADKAAAMKAFQEQEAK